MTLFKLYHSDGIHIITDVKKHKTNIELKTITGEVLYIKVSAQIKGIHFRVISDTKKYEI